MYITIEKALEILELSKDFTREELKHNYRKLAKTYHPDVASDEKREEFQRLNAANDLLIKYLNDPEVAKVESEKAKKNSTTSEDIARKKQEEEKRKEKEKIKKNYEEKKRYTNIYNELSQLDFFKNLNITLEDFMTSKILSKELFDSLLSLAKEIKGNLNQYIETYNRFNQNRTFISPNITNVVTEIKRNTENRKKRRNYTETMTDDFKDLNASFRTVYNRYLEYKKIGEVLDRNNRNGLKEYVICGDEYREIIMKNAKEKVEYLFKLQQPKLDNDVKSDFVDLNNSKYISEIRNTNAILRYITEHYKYDYILGCYPKNYNDVTSEEILKKVNKIHKHYGAKTKVKLEDIAFIICCLFNMRSVIYSFIPSTVFDPNKSMDTLPDALSKFEDIKKIYYLCVSNKTMKPAFDAYMKYKDKYKEKGIFDTLSLFINYYKNIESINSFSKNYSIEELMELSQDEYNNLLKKTVQESQFYDELKKKDKDAIIYHKIYLENKEKLGEKSFSEVVHVIKERCIYLQCLGLETDIKTLYKLSDEELQKKIDFKTKEDKIIFILRNHPNYTDTYVDSEELAKDFSKDPSLKLRLMNQDKFNMLYRETYLLFVNSAHPIFKENTLSIEEYDKLNDEKRKKILLEAYKEKNLIYLVTELNKYRAIQGLHIFTMEEVHNMDNNAKFELEMELYIYKTPEINEAFKHSNEQQLKDVQKYYEKYIRQIKETDEYSSSIFDQYNPSSSNRKNGPKL